jgi:hypothetical protein
MISFPSSALAKYPVFTLGVTTRTGGNVTTGVPCYMKMSGTPLWRLAVGCGLRRGWHGQDRER